VVIVGVQLTPPLFKSDSSSGSSSEGPQLVPSQSSFPQGSGVCGPGKPNHTLDSMYTVCSKYQ